MSNDKSNRDRGNYVYQSHGSGRQSRPIQQVEHVRHQSKGKVENILDHRSAIGAYDGTIAAKNYENELLLNSLASRPAALPPAVSAPPENESLEATHEQSNVPHPET